MNKIKLKDLKGLSFYLTPNFQHIETKRYKIKLSSIISYLVVYSLIIVFLTTLLYMILPSDKLIFLFENNRLTKEIERVENLEKKVINLSGQLENISSINKRLKYALIIAQSDSLDSNSVLYDSLRFEENPNIKTDGNILRAVMNLFQDQKKMFSSDIFIKPTNGLISRNFDTGEGHYGIDFGVKEKTPVVASGSGYVIFSNFVADGGNTIILVHENDYITIYKHCSLLLKTTSEVVKKGEIIALSGNSGKSSAPHLHFEIWKNGKPINPNEILVNLTNQSN